MSMDDPSAIACRRLWVEVVAQVMMGYWEARRAAARQAGGNPQRAVDDARRYFQSPDGREVLTLAGIDPSAKAIERIITLIAGDASPFTLMTKQHAEKVAR